MFLLVLILLSCGGNNNVEPNKEDDIKSFDIKLEQERLEKEEKDRQLKQEAARLAQQAALEQERLAREEKDRQLKLEATRLAQQAALEQERLEKAAVLERERLAKEEKDRQLKLEATRLAQQAALEQERLEKEERDRQLKQEAARLAQQTALEQERLAREEKDRQLKQEAIVLAQQALQVKSKEAVKVVKSEKEIIDFILKRYCSIHSKDINQINNYLKMKNMPEPIQYNLLMVAMGLGELDGVKILLNNLQFTEDSKVHFSVLEQAARMGNAEMVKLLLNEGSNKLSQENIQDIFYVAIQKNNKDVISILLDNKAKVDGKYAFDPADKVYREPKEVSALFHAINSNNLDLVKLLLDKGAKMDEFEYDETPLLLSLKRREIEIAKYLINKGAKVDKKGVKDAGSAGGRDSWVDVVPIFEAIKIGDLELIQLLIDKGANIDSRFYSSSDVRVNALMYFIQLNIENEELAKILIEKTKDLNDTDVEGRTALILAAITGNKRIVELLIEKKVNLDKIYFFQTKDSYGWISQIKNSALMSAIRNKYEEIAMLLFESGADINIDYTFNEIKNTALICAIEKNMPKLVIKLIEKLKVNNKDSLKEVDNLGKTLLMLVISSGMKNEEICEIAKLLIEAGVDLNKIFKNSSKDKENSSNVIELSESALTLAIKNKHNDVAKLLINSNVDVSLTYIFPTGQKGNALMYAIKEDNFELAKILVEKMIPDLLNMSGENVKTALILALEKGELDLVELLIDRGADPNIIFEEINKNNVVPLFKAIEMKNKKLVNLLIDKGADVNKLYSINGHKLNALIYAIQMCNEIEVLENLINITRKECLNVTDSTGRTALILVIESKMESEKISKIVKLLIEKDVDLNRIFKHKINVKRGDYNSVVELEDSALTIAIREKKNDIADLLLDGKVDLSTTYNFNFMFAFKSTALTYAIREENFDIAKKIIPIVKKVEKEDLMIALRISNQQLREEISLNLIEKISGFQNENEKMKIEAVDMYETALIFSIQQNYQDILVKLMETQIDLNKFFSITPFGTYKPENQTLLMYAIREGKLELSKILIEKMNDVDQVDENGRTALIFSLMKEKEDLALILLDKAKNIDQISKSSMNLDFSALTLAVEKGYTKVVNKLIEKGINIDQVDKQGRTALIFSLIKEVENVALILAETAKNVDQMYKMAWNSDVNALILAIDKGYLALFSKLIEKSENLSKIFVLNASQERNSIEKENLTLLIYAIKKDKFDFAKLLINKMNDVDQVDGSGKSALIIALEKKQDDLVLILLNKAKNKDQVCYALILTIKNDNLTLFDKILEKEDLNFDELIKVDSEELTALMYAIKVGKLGFVNKLLEKIEAKDAKSRAPVAVKVSKTPGASAQKESKTPGASAQKVSKTQGASAQKVSKTPGASAQKESKTQGASAQKVSKTPGASAQKESKTQGASAQAVSENMGIDKRNKLGETALILACQSGNVDIFKSVISKKPDVNKFSESKDTPLMYAIKAKSIEIFKILIDIKNIDIDKQNKLGETALILACQSGNLELFNSLISKKPDVNKCSQSVDTALIAAVKSQNLEMVSTLMEKGATVAYKNREGKTALGIARALPNQSIIDILKNK